jgi:hypothetical protein
LLAADLPPAAIAAIEVVAMAVLPLADPAAATGVTVTVCAQPASDASPIPHVIEEFVPIVAHAAAGSPADFAAAAENAAPTCTRPSIASASQAFATTGLTAEDATTSQEAMMGEWSSPSSTSVGATANPLDTVVTTFRVPHGSTGAFLP